MAERCKDCQWNGVCTEFARCILEPIPEGYDDLSTGAVLAKILENEGPGEHPLAA